MKIGSDRREFSRLDIRVDCTLYLGNIEIICQIRDISERGICLLVDDEIVKQNSIAVGTEMEFQYADVYEYFNEKRKAIISGKCKIMRIVSSDMGTILGCVVERGGKYEEYEEYVENRKVGEFVNSEMELFLWDKNANN